MSENVIMSDGLDRNLFLKKERFSLQIHSHGQMEESGSCEK